MRTPLISQKDFFEKYKIKDEDFSKTGLNWDDLVTIYNDYEKLKPKLEATASYILNILLKIKNIHSIRYRIKDSEHVLEKIIRKRIKDPTRIIDLQNYNKELTDLIGFRAIHIFKEQYFSIHNEIKSHWELKEIPIIYHRTGDEGEHYKAHIKDEVTFKVHEKGYRSIHYIIETQPSKEKHFVEIQVRTIYEEAWSEIDHIYGYPHNEDNLVIQKSLFLLNRLSGMSDEMGTFIKDLDNHIKETEKSYDEEIKKQNKIIEDLKLKLSKIKEDNPSLDVNTLINDIEELSKLNSSKEFTVQWGLTGDWIALF